MTRLTLLAAAAVCTLAGGAAGAHQESSRTGAVSADTTCPLSDALGDSGTAPDITAVTVSNDATGKISFRIDVANRPQWASDDSIHLNLDTDRNSGTGWAGAPYGGDYVIEFRGSDRTFRLLRWTGSVGEQAPASTLSGSHFPGGLSISINRNDLGGASVYWFWVWAWQGADPGAAGHYDDAGRNTLTIELETSGFLDPRGDGGGAPDITCVLVSNNAEGQLYIQIDHSTLPALESDVAVGVFLDTDRNPRTGATSRRGADYLIAAWLASGTADILRWNGSDFQSVVTASTASWTRRHAYQLLSINRSELGGTRGFNFWVRAAQGSDLFGAQRADDAPATGTWSYQLTTTRPVSLTELVERVRSGVIRIEADTCDGQEIGSGILIGPRHVATVEHVVADARAIVLKRNGRSLGTATVIGRDRGRDVALLQTKRALTGYRFPLASRAPEVGDPVAVLGYPAGLPLSVTRGSVSGLKRSVRIDGVTRRGLVQTDAAVNHGSSGGPLLSIETGSLLGLVDLGSTQLNGIAFAVSTQVAKPLLTAWKASPQPRPAVACGS